MNYMYRNNMPQQMMGYNQMDHSEPMHVVVMEPHVFKAASSLVEKYVVIETTRGSISGVLIEAKPDHVVVKQRDSLFFIRLCEIIWIMPE